MSCDILYFRCILDSNKVYQNQVLLESKVVRRHVKTKKKRKQ